MRDSLYLSLKRFAELTVAVTGIDHSNTPGAGAADGLDFAFLSYLQGDLKPGIELVLNTVGIEDALEGAELVFTGEGCLDYQTAMGKAPVCAKLTKLLK